MSSAPQKPPAATLAGRSVLITCSQPGNDKTARQLRALGGVPLQLPALTIQPLEDPASLRQALGRLTDFDALLITSAHGARAFLDQKPNPDDTPVIHAVGSKSAALLQKAGFTVRVPEQAADAEALAAHLLERPRPPQRLLFLQAETGRENLVQRLTKAGCHVERQVAYRAMPLEAIPKRITDALEQGRLDGALFFSGRTVASLLDPLTLPQQQALKKITLAALSPITAETMAKHGFPPQVIAPPPPSSEGLLAALADYWRESP